MTLLPLARRAGARAARTRGAARGRIRPARRLAAVGVLAGALALGGCADLRLETPPPPTPTPDAVEVVRERTAADATELAALATEAALSAPEAVATVLGRVAETCLAHAEAFGGVYEPFPPTTPGATASPGVGAGATVAPTPPPADAAAVLDALTAAAAAARTDADAAPDGDLGRLLASVWVSRTLLGDTLAAAVAAGGTEAAPAPIATPPAVPGEPPLGVDAADLGLLIRSEDAAGLVWEVVAARSADAVRADAEGRATLHRDRAEDWAVATDVARTDADPRLAAYDLPAELIVDGATPDAMAAVTTDVEAALGVLYASLVARADPGARGPLLDAMLDQVRRGLAAGAPTPAFPGLPERA